MIQSDLFTVFQIFMPIVAFAIIIICCTSVCKAVHRARQERAVQGQALHPPSVYVLPLSLASQDLRETPPRYSSVDLYSSPPPYNELELKPDVIPCEPPPAYTECSPSPSHSLQPAQTHTPAQLQAF